MKTAFDFDWTLLIPLINIWWAKSIFMYPNRNLPVKKSDVRLIITGRHSSRIWSTMFWLKLWGFNNVERIIFRETIDWSKQSIILSKVEALVLERVAEYYDDEEAILFWLRYHLPQITLHQVKT